MSAYYNERDPKAAAWLRELINRGLIAPGFVDERSIEDVIPDELAGYTQCHFFAGIGVWSYALRQAGWEDDRPVWTGSCPCQPFSAAGKRTGTADERHLWPAFFHLINQCRPDVVFGEQVASKDGLAWLDLVRSDLEGASYAVGAADLCAAGFGAPHIRQRLYWVADSSRHRWEQRQSFSSRRDEGDRTQGRARRIAQHCEISIMANTCSKRLEGWQEQSAREECQAAQRGNHAGGMADNDRCKSRSASNGFWRDADWLRCGDGKYRPVESGTFPLVDGAAARVGRLRGYGNAIVAPVAKAFIESYLAT
jgi:DNA (cytosine-5)-methyltransferase 1